MKKESLVAEIMNYIVSGYVYFVAFLLVLYMVSALVAGFLGFGTALLDISSSAKGILSSPVRADLELKLLHTITFTFVLVKAYKILISFAQMRAINIKLLIEIAIIAPTIELIFNIKQHSFEVNVLFAIFAIANLIAYLVFYKTIQTVNADYQKDHTCEPVPASTAKTTKRSTKTKKKS